MQMDKALKLSKRTPMEEKKNCKHNFEKEYNNGTHTGDHACTICGSTIASDEYRKGNFEAICY